ncbi:MAG TPA: ABC transporter ATP-binding protein [Stellaceae bacterium]|nr:ABC transporter ATP-binding protein [Stellaceae bacterium]
MTAETVDTLAAPRLQGLRALLPFIATKRAHFIITVASGVLAQIANVVAAATGAWLVGHAVQGAPPESLTGAFWLLGVAVLAAASCKWWQTFISHDFAYGLIEVLQVGIYDGLERAAPAYVLGRRTGDLASVATADADLMEWFYAHVLGDYIGAVIVPLGVLATLAAIHPIMALVLLPFLPLVASVPFWLAKRAGEQGRAMLTALGGINAEVVEGVQGLRELTAFGAGRQFLDRLMRETRLVHVIQMRYGVRAGLEQAAIDVLLALAVLATVTTGLLLVSSGSLGFALYPMAVVLAGAALAPITEVTQTARKLGELRAGADRVSTIFHQEAQVEDRGTAAPSQVKDSSVRFERVDFGYGGGRARVLSGLDCTLAPGETVALVGESGAGKTTCANLLMRFWDPNEGTIRVGGCDIRELPIEALRRKVTLVPQDVYLFNGSVADNIRLGRPDASDAEIERAARLAQAHDFIAALPQGYATQCGERGTRLSGGQRQRIAIARAFLRDAPVLIMDEAVSNLDTESEEALRQAMHEVRRGRTVLIIAHRPSTIRSADRILMLEGGRIVEDGSHEALLARGGAYARFILAKEQEEAGAAAS